MGDPVALVVATSPEAAAAALAMIEVEYRLLPAVFTPDDALADGAPQIHPGGNLLAENWLRSGDIAEGFARADVVVENTYTTPWNEHAYLEPEAALAFWDGDTLVVRTSTQYSHYHRAEIARTLGLPVERVRVIPTVSGGAFGGKTDISCQCLVALATYRTGRPVRIVYSRAESFVSTTKRHPYRIRVSKRRHARRRPHRPPGRHARRHRRLRVVRARAHGQDVRLGDRSLPLAERRAPRPGGVHEQPDGRLHARPGHDPGRVRRRVADGPARRAAGHGSSRAPGCGTGLRQGDRLMSGQVLERDPAYGATIEAVRPHWLASAGAVRRVNRRGRARGAAGSAWRRSGTASAAGEAARCPARIPR